MKGFTKITLCWENIWWVFCKFDKNTNTKVNSRSRKHSKIITKMRSKNPQLKIFYKLWYTRIVPIIAPPLRQKTFPCFHEGGQLLGIFTFFDSINRHFQMSSSELKLYFIAYYRPLVYFEVFSIYLSVFHEFMWSPKKAKKKFLGDFLDFWIFFFLVFARGGGNYWDNSGIEPISKKCQ